MTTYSSSKRGYVRKIRNHRKLIEEYMDMSVEMKPQNLSIFTNLIIDESRGGRNPEIMQTYVELVKIIVSMNPMQGFEELLKVDHVNSLARTVNPQLEG